jgi:hypothetical protein
MQEEGLHLVDASRCNEDEVKDGEHTQLEIEGAIADLPEREATEEGRKDVQVDLVPDVVLASR